MSVPEFLDTNVLVYAYDSSVPRKQRIAQDLVRTAVAGGILISVQVLAEFAATLLHKVSPAVRAEDVAALLDALAPIPVIVPDAEMVRRAVEARAEYGVHFYDGLVLAAAERGGCGRIWSEDLKAGQRYFGVLASGESLQVASAKSLPGSRSLAVVVLTERRAALTR